MKIANYTVHSVSDAPFTIMANVAGQDREVNINGLVVEVISEGGLMSHTLRITDDIDAARKLFTVGNAVNLNITAWSK